MPADEPLGRWCPSDEDRLAPGELTPASRSPLSVKATMEGVVREPSALGMTVASPPSHTAITDRVMYRSIPTALPMRNSFACHPRRPRVSGGGGLSSREVACPRARRRADTGRGFRPCQGVTGRRATPAPDGAKFGPSSPGSAGGHAARATSRGARRKKRRKGVKASPTACLARPTTPRPVRRTGASHHAASAAGRRPPH